MTRIIHTMHAVQLGVCAKNVDLWMSKNPYTLMSSCTNRIASHAASGDRHRNVKIFPDVSQPDLSTANEKDGTRIMTSEQGRTIFTTAHISEILQNIRASCCSSTSVCPSLKVWSNSEEERTFRLMCSKKKCSWVIPLAGNAFVTAPQTPPEEEAQDNFVSDCGISNWSDASKVISTFFHSTRPGHVLLALRARVPGTAGLSSRVKVSVSHAKPPTLMNEIDGPSPLDAEVDEDIRLVEDSEGRQSQTTNLDLSGSKWGLVPCGKFFLPMDGYIKFDLQGLERSGEFFADVTHLVIIPESDWFTEQTCVKFVADPADFYWGRRGPSVHLRYILPEERDMEYFYTELEAPVGQDVIGSYFCAAGFRGGYFGMQVNSSTERRILFSIWSEWNTDNPGDIPDEYKVVLLRKGPGVIDGEFGDEGSGGQSYLVYPWVAGQTYRFLVFATKDGDEDTIYTAWFNPSGSPTGWRLIASFFKPKDSTFLKDLYAFSENFIPEQGHLERKCLYGQQWACDRDKQWTELSTAEFTADATANANNRMDISGGVDDESGHFFLRNCGFFSDKVDARTMFERPKTGNQPQIDFDNLP